MLIVVSGPSGVGKGSLIGGFLKQAGDRFFMSVSATTRPPRSGEIDGSDYYFLSRGQFLELIEQSQMLEYAEYGGNLYGTPKGAVERERELGRHVILDIEIQGAMYLKKLYPEAVFIFILPPSMEELRRRLMDRGTETAEDLEQRIAVAEQELTHTHEYDYLLVNDDLEQCIRAFETVVTAALHSPRHMFGLTDILKREKEM